MLEIRSIPKDVHFYVQRNQSTIRLESMIQMRSEDCSHLFFQCPLAQEAWRGAAVARLSVTSEETFWSSLLGGSFRREADWRRIFATLWAIWIHRNEVIFKGISPSGDAITHTAEGFYFSWHRGGIGPSNFVSLL